MDEVPTGSRLARPSLHNAIIPGMSQASQVLRPDHPLSIDDAIDEIAQPAPAPRIATGLAKSAIIVAASFVLSRVLGLAREIILARQFGTGPEMDAYVSAFRI